MARSKKPDTTTEKQDASKDPHRGMGGSFVNPGGVNHDVESEPDKQLVERTEHRDIRDAEEINRTEDDTSAPKE